MRPGYLRDLRRLTVALSRSRLGLYILGRKDVFDSCFEVQDAFKLPFQRPTKLEVVPGEMFNSTKRLVDDDVKGTEMTGVEHLGQYVFEMTQAKIQQLKKDGAKMPPPAAIGDADQVVEAFGDSGDDGDVLDEDVGEGEGEVDEEEGAE